MYLPNQLGASKMNAVGQLQSALEALSRRVDDHQIATTLDGKMGPLTRDATNRALKLYTSAPNELRTGQLTQAQILAQISSITSYVMAGKRVSSSGTAATTSSVARPVVATTLRPASIPGGPMPAPGYYSAPSYYPPPYAPYPPRGPGGLPTDRATLDVKAFIPAQYQHVRVSPGGVALVLLAGVVIIMLVNKDKKK